MTEAPKGYEPDHPPIFDGGSPKDHAELLRLYFDFRLANDGLDNDALRKIWEPDAGHVYFNTNGHAYHGLEDWLHIWDHYRTRLQLVKPGGSGTIRITVRGEMALITDDMLDVVGVSGTPAQVARRLRERNDFADRTNLVLYNETEPEAVVDVVRGVRGE